MPSGAGELNIYDLNVRDSLVLHHTETHHVYIEDKYFASGGCREAFYAYFQQENKQWGPKMVAKKYLRSESFLEDYVCARMAYECARAFNLLNPPKPIDYLVPNQIFSLNDVSYSIEKHLQGEWQKHNNIFGMILSDRQTPNAFSHFSYIFSCRQYIILDVQGVGNTFTDPAIVSNEQGKFGYTDTGLKGIRDFFKNHVCNDVCRCLKLENSNSFEVPRSVPVQTWVQPLQARALPVRERIIERVPERVVSEGPMVKVVECSRPKPTAAEVKRSTNAIMARPPSAASEVRNERKESVQLNSFLQGEVDRLFQLTIHSLKKMLADENLDSSGSDKKELISRLVLHFYPDYKSQIRSILQSIEIQPIVPNHGHRPVSYDHSSEPDGVHSQTTKPRLYENHSFLSSATTKSPATKEDRPSPPPTYKEYHYLVTSPVSAPTSNVTKSPVKSTTSTTSTAHPPVTTTTSVYIPPLIFSKHTTAETGEKKRVSNLESDPYPDSALNSPGSYRVSEPFQRTEICSLSVEDVPSLSTKQLRARLYCLGIDFSDCFTKDDLADKLTSFLTQQQHRAAPEQKPEKRADVAPQPVAPKFTAAPISPPLTTTEDYVTRTAKPTQHPTPSGYYTELPNGKFKEPPETSAPVALAPKVASTAVEHRAQACSPTPAEFAYGGAPAPPSSTSTIPPRAQMEQHMSLHTRRTWAIVQSLGETAFLKYGKTGNPHRRLLEIMPRWTGSLFQLYLTWRDTVDKDQHGEIALDEIVGLQVGSAAPKFQRHLLAGEPGKIYGRRGQVHDSALCFSVAFSKRSLDLLALTKSDFQAWVEGFRALILERGSVASPSSSFLRVSSSHSAANGLSPVDFSSEPSSPLPLPAQQLSAALIKQLVMKS